MSTHDRTSVPVRTALTMDELTGNDDVEMWLFRMPLHFNAEKLAKKKLKIDEAAGAGAVLQVADVQRARSEVNQDDQDEDGMPGGEVSGDSYEVLLGDASEIGAYQVLVQASGDAAGVLRVAPSITRHFVVAQCPLNTPSAAADSVYDAKQPAIMTLAHSSRMVVPYTHVPQIQGLEARFKMPGAGSAPPPPQWWKEGVKVKKEEKDDEEEEKEKPKAMEEKEQEGILEIKKRKNTKHRASDGGPLKKGGEGGEEDMSSPEKVKKVHKHRKSSRRRSV